MELAILVVLACTIVTCLPIVLIIWLVSRKRGGHNMTSDEEERLRSLWSLLQRMEERVENLETILDARRRHRRDDALEEHTHPSRRQTRGSGGER